MIDTSSSTSAHDFHNLLTGVCVCVCVRVHAQIYALSGDCSAHTAFEAKLTQHISQQHRFIILHIC
jgi:hypothetical protein